MTSGPPSSSDILWRETDSSQQGRRMEDLGFLEKKTFFLHFFLSLKPNGKRKTSAENTYDLLIVALRVQINPVCMGRVNFIMFPDSLIPGTWATGIVRSNTMGIHQSHADVWSPPRFCWPDSTENENSRGTAPLHPIAFNSLWNIHRPKSLMLFLKQQQATSQWVH